jgi:hypothetical protein
MKRLLLFAALIAWSGMASAVVYKWVDAQGKVQYGDRPPDGVHAEIVELLGTHVPRSDSAKPDSSAPASSAPKSADSPSAAKKQVSDDVAQARDKQCADAQERYKKLIEGRRLYKTGPNGERQYLTSEEIDKERLEAKTDVDSICNSPT